MIFEEESQALQENDKSEAPVRKKTGELHLLITRYDKKGTVFFSKEFIEINNL